MQRQRNDTPKIVLCCHTQIILRGSNLKKIVNCVKGHDNGWKISSVSNGRCRFISNSKKKTWKRRKIKWKRVRQAAAQSLTRARVWSWKRRFEMAYHSLLDGSVRVPISDIKSQRYISRWMEKGKHCKHLTHKHKQKIHTTGATIPSHQEIPQIVMLRTKN